GASAFVTIGVLVGEYLERVLVDEVGLDRVVAGAEIVPEAAAGREGPEDSQAEEQAGEAARGRVDRLVPLACVEHRRPPFPAPRAHQKSPGVLSPSGGFGREDIASPHRADKSRITPARRDAGRWPAEEPGRGGPRFTTAAWRWC